ncbi:MAG: histidine ammonia-lyase [Myxococcales bacterium]|nr:histidine ammonia-lyase [Myxococcales bacterium]
MTPPNGTSAALSIGRPIEILDVHRVARLGQPARLDAEARAELTRTRAHLEREIAGGATIYGVNTGFGALSDRRVAREKLSALQRNLLRSHAVGVGPRLPRDVVRALLLLRAHTLAMGASGVSPALADQLLKLLAADLTPVVPSQGSVGASGDLAPLAHLALAVLGEGEVERPDGATVPARAALEAAGIAPYRLGPKEGLSLINGTQVMTAIGALALHDAAELVVAADVLGALTLDATLGSIAAFDPRIHAGKPHPGQRASASLIRALVNGSPLNDSHRDCGRVQDAYSLRCMPQVHGAVRGALAYVAAAARVEINSFTDNPLVLPRDDEGFDVLSGGNFHGATIAVPLDHMTAALTTLGTISERRLDRLLNPNTSRGLPAFLAEQPGLESGFMMAQVTAAALASENKGLSMPASVDTIPTSAGKEDHVSMGPIAARKLRAVVDNVARILAVEAAVTARALDLRHHETSPALQRVHALIRESIAPFTGDRSMARELERFAEVVLSGAVREAVELPHPLDPGA